MLGKPQSGTGIVKIAGWMIVMLAAAPVIYSAAALQVTSEPLKAPVPTYAAEFGRNPLPRARSLAPSQRPQPAPDYRNKVAQQDSPIPAVDLRTLFQMELDVIAEIAVRLRGIETEPTQSAVMAMNPCRYVQDAGYDPLGFDG